MLKISKFNIYQITFYFLSILVSITILTLIYHFDKIAVNIFEMYDYFNIFPNPYYQISWGFFTFIIITIVLLYFSSNSLYIWSWILKAFITLFILLVLEYLYSGLDQFFYYVDASYASDRFDKPFYESGTIFVIKFNALVSFFFGKSLYSMKVISSFISFLGLILFYKTYLLLIDEEYETVNTHSLFPIILFVMPSFLIWTSLVGKDALIIFPIALFIYSYFSFLKEKKLFFLLIIVISIVLAFLIRPWIAMILIMTVLIHNIKLNRYFFLVFIVSLPIFYLIFLKIFPSLGISSISELFSGLGQMQQSFSRGGSKVELPLIENNWDYIMYFIPNAFITLFYPLPFLGTSNIFLWFFSLENLILLILILRYLLPNIQKIFLNYNTRFFLILIFSWLLIYVILSPGNLGTAIRYKVQVLPILMLLILLAKNSPYNFKDRKLNV